jgi:hypothetical protein
MKSFAVNHLRAALAPAALHERIANETLLSAAAPDQAAMLVALTLVWAGVVAVTSAGRLL